jgi:glucose-1-phosphate thymidylyltransferase
VLGDNIFYGHDWPRDAASARARGDGATVFAYHGARPRALRRGRVRRTAACDQPRGEAREARSRYAVTGLYFYDNDVVDIAAR